MARGPVIHRIASVTVSIALCASALGACGSDSEGNAGSSILSEVAPYAEGSTGSVSFVDWRTLQDDYDGADLASDDQNGVLGFFESFGQEADIGSYFSSSPATDLETVGFTALDLDWEAQILSDGPPVNILKFEEGADLDAVETTLDECGYEPSDSEAGTIYEIDPAVGCEGGPLGFVSPSLATIAIDTDARIAVAAPSPEAMDAAQSAAEAGDDSELDAALDDIGGQLDGLVAGTIRFGDEACAPAVPARATPAQLEQIQAETSDLGEPFDTILAGYVVSDAALQGLIALDYADSADAEAALDPRVDAFENGISFVTNQPFTDIFSLDSSEVDDDVVEFRLSSPEAGSPISLFGALQRNDLAFAGCPLG